MGSLVACAMVQSVFVCALPAVQPGRAGPARARDAREVIELARPVEAESHTFRAQVELSIGNADDVSSAIGSLVWTSPGRAMASKFQFEGRIRWRGGEARELALGFNHSEYWLIDRAARSIRRGPAPGVLGDLDGIAAELVSMQGLNTHTLEFNGFAGLGVVGGQECYVIAAVTPLRVMTYWISTADLRVRQFIDLEPQPKAKAACRTIRLTDLSIDPQFLVDPFTPVVPEGYREEPAQAPAKPKRGK